MHRADLIHIASVRDGAIVEFPHSAYAYMKVCGPDGNGAVVRLSGGLLLTYRELEKRDLGVFCRVIANNVDELYREEDE